MRTTCSIVLGLPKHRGDSAHSPGSQACPNPFVATLDGLTRRRKVRLCGAGSVLNYRVEAGLLCTRHLRYAGQCGHGRPVASTMHRHGVGDMRGALGDPRSHVFLAQHLYDKAASGRPRRTPLTRLASEPCREARTPPRLSSRLSMSVIVWVDSA